MLNVLEVIAPFKHFNKLREFVQMKLPPGFPVKLGKMTTTALALYFQMGVLIHAIHSQLLWSFGKELLHKNFVVVDFRRKS